MNIDEMPMVRVTWTDARDMETGWVSIKEIFKAPLANCQDVGWMVVNNDEKIVIMRSWALDEEKEEDQEGGGSTAIPKCWVKKIEYLEVSNSARWKFTGKYEDL